MLNLKPATLARIAPALALMSCAAPKAIVVEEAPKTKTGEITAAPEPLVPNKPDDGIRLPDMLGLPDEGELRSAASVPNKTPESGAVIARPPSGAPEKP
jgi:hypothetical protein